MTRLAIYAVSVCALFGAAASVLAQTIATVRVIPSAVTPGKSTVGRVVLTKPAEKDTFVTLSGQLPFFNFQKRLPIKKGTTAGAFTITTQPGDWYGRSKLTLTASVGNSTATGSITPFIDTRDIATRRPGMTEIASRNSQNAQAYGASGEPSDLPRGDVRTISADGRLVVFTSLANNLVPNDGNRVSDVFLRDLHNGVTRRISEGTGGVQANARSYHPCISSDGKHIAFTSDATNLVPGSPPHSNVYLYRISDGKLSLISGMEANDDSDQPSINANGSVVAFASYASNLTSGPADGYQDVFVYVRKTGRIELVSQPSGRSGTNGHSWHPSVNGDGNFVSFTSQSDRFGPLDYNGYADVYLRDRQNRRTELISAKDDGSNLFEPTFFSSISEDANRIAMGGNRGQVPPRVRDRALNRTLVPVGLELAASTSQNFALSGDGRYLAATYYLDGSNILYSLEQLKIVSWHNSSVVATDRCLSRNGRFYQFTSASDKGNSTYIDYNPFPDTYVTEWMTPFAMPVLQTPALVDDMMKLKVYLTYAAAETSSAFVRWSETTIPPVEVVFAPGQTVAELDLKVPVFPDSSTAILSADYAASQNSASPTIHRWFLCETEFSSYRYGTTKLNATIRVAKPVTARKKFRLSYPTAEFDGPREVIIPTGSKSVTFEFTIKAGTPAKEYLFFSYDEQSNREHVYFRIENP